MKKILLLLALAAPLFFSCDDGNTIVVGSKGYTEQYIAAELIALQLEDAGFSVDRRFGMSSLSLRQAMLSGQVDICADYTGTAWGSYLKQSEPVRDPQVLFDRVKALDEPNGIIWAHKMNINNTYAMAVTKARAAEKGLKTLEDLAALEIAEDQRYGLAHEFSERADGFRGMKTHYGFETEKSQVTVMDIGLTYEALKSGGVDVSMVFATDGNIIKHNLAVLKDSKRFFPVYSLSLVATEELVETHPEALEIAGRAAEFLSQEEITLLNYRVDAEGVEADVVAREFLREKGLIE